MSRPDDLQLLSQARQRATALLEDLLHHQAELDASSTIVEATQLEAGRQALHSAVDSARRMVHSIDQALAAARGAQGPL
ncbi:MAG TPA: hypothetical protein VHP11_08045 [Tepidisphaeraceae bacterium]|nr:hypothetical protein [Tepidisphaeraceae bacterium]